MPLDVPTTDTIKFPNPTYLTLESFRRGVITLVNQGNLPKNALARADNIILVEDGKPSVRPGMQWYGSAMPNGQAIDGFDYYDTGSSTHLLAAAGGTVYRSTDDGVTWTSCTGASLTAAAEANMVQYNSFQYLTTGLDVITRYNGTTTLQTYTVLSTPSAALAAVSGGMTGSGFTTYYKISAVSAVGFSIASSKVTVTATQPRGNYNTASNFVTLTLPAYQATQTRYDIYYSEDDLNYYYLDSQASPGLTYVDNGSAIIVPSTTAPTTNTTQGPTVAELTVVGNRLYGVRDPGYLYRIWFTSGTSPLGSFSNGYDGGYLDWQPGGKYFPVKVEDYRDGKGTSVATVWLNSADSQGAIIQMSLGTLTVGNLSITVPSAYKLPGSRGTPAPKSVVNVLNDYHFYNTQAFYGLGNKADLIQILSTDELSGNIRPTVRTINPAAESKICSIYYDGRVYTSVPYGASTSNNATIVYDTELKAWLPKAYDVGFKKFLRYTSADGVHHLLGLKEGDTRLTELGTLYTNSASIRGDYGAPFQTDLLTGLYPVTKDRYSFQFTEEMEYELSDPVDQITIELLGIDHAKGFTSIKTVPLNVTSSSSSSTGWDTYAWDTTVWDNTAIVPTIVSEVSFKRYTVVNRELNAIQWHLTTATLAAAYVLRSLQTWGTDTQDAHPSKWRQKAS